MSFYVKEDPRIYTSSRQFLEFLRPGKEWLKKHTPQEISRNANVPFDEDGSFFLLKSLGREIKITYPEFDFISPFGEWHHLITLHYLDVADGMPMSTNIASFGELSGGLIRGTNFDRESAGTLSHFFGRKPLENVKKACEAMGADFPDSNADLCAVFPFFPMYPITFKLWFADDELEGSGRLFVNKSADHYLLVEDAVTVGSIIVDGLIKEYNALFE